MWGSTTRLPLPKTRVGRRAAPGGSTGRRSVWRPTANGAVSKAECRSSSRCGYPPGFNYGGKSSSRAKRAPPTSLGRGGPPRLSAVLGWRRSPTKNQRGRQTVNRQKQASDPGTARSTPRRLAGRSGGAGGAKGSKLDCLILAPELVVTGWGDFLLGVLRLLLR